MLDDRQSLYMAAIDCPHTIEDRKITLRFDPSKPGNNALDQLGNRLEACEKSRGLTVQEVFARNTTTRYVDGADQDQTTPPAVMPAAPSDAQIDEVCQGIATWQFPGHNAAEQRRLYDRAIARAVLRLSQTMQPQTEGGSHAD